MLQNLMKWCLLHLNSALSGRSVLSSDMLGVFRQLGEGSDLVTCAEVDAPPTMMTSAYHQIAVLNMI